MIAAKAMSMGNGMYLNEQSVFQKLLE